MKLAIILILYLLSLVAFLLGLKKQWRFIKFADLLFLCLGLGLHGGSIIKRGFDAQRIPITDTYETLILFSFLVVVIGSVLYFRHRTNLIRIASFLMAFVILIFSMFIVDDIRPLMPALRSGWLYIHVGAYFIAYSSFAISFAVCLLYLGVLAINKWKKVYDKFLLELEGLIFKIIDLGFPFLTLGIATGAIWASVSWGRFWSWDPKEVWAFVTWMIYASCLHFRHAHNLRSKYAALLAALGFICILFTYIGVNLFFDTLHSYA